MNLKFFQLTYKTVDEFFKDSCLVRSSGLAYNTLLSLVPFSALLFSLFNAFGAFSDVKKALDRFLINQLVPTEGHIISKYIDMFVANSGGLGIIGLLVFAFTSVMLLDNIQANFNSIWGTPVRNSLISKFTVYVSIIVVGSFLISASFSISRFISINFPKDVIEGLNIIYRFFIRIFPSIFIFLTFLILFIIIPSGKVRLKSAFIGAITGAILWQFVKTGFIFLISKMFMLSVIYGSITFIPIFLFWLYLVWIVILFSIEVTYVHQHYDSPWKITSFKRMKPVDNMEIGLSIFMAIARQFFRGRKPHNLSSLVRQFRLPEGQIKHFIRLFSNAGLILQVREKQAFIPGKSIATIKISDVLLVLYGRSKNKSKNLPNKLIQGFSNGAFTAIGENSIEEILESQDSLA